MTADRRIRYEFGAFRLDPVEKVLFRGDRPVALTPKALETLLALVERQGHVVTKDELLRRVWPDTFVEENNLAQHISMLRRVLDEGETGRPSIETVPRRGYRFVEPVTPRTDGDDGGGSGEVPANTDVPAHVPRAAQGKRRRTSVLAVSLAAVVIAAVILSGRWRSGAADAPASDTAGSSARPGGVTRLAVLPFVNLGTPDDEYFVAGMTEEITSRLAGLNHVAVASSTTATAYDRTGKSVRRIGADLGVEYVVEGSARWSHAHEGPQVRIIPKLVRASDDTVVWTHEYDASLPDLFRVQADIAYRITSAMQVALEARERRLVEVRPTGDTEAYLAYLRAIMAWQQATSDTALQSQARNELELAVARDPRFALAWSALSRVYAMQYSTGAERTRETRAAAERAADTAIRLDPGLPEGHMARAGLLSLDRDHEAVLRELDIARAGLPNSAELHRLVGVEEQRRGRWPEALAAYTRGFDLDPALLADAIAVHYLHRRQYADANRFLAIARAAHRTAVAVPEAWSHFSERADVAAARGALEPALGTRPTVDGRVRGLLARLEWFDGRFERALELIRGMDPAGAWLPMDFRFPSTLAAGQVYDSMGRRNDAAKSYGAAMAELEQRARTNPEDYQVEAAMGLALAGLGRATDAVRHGERAVALLPVSRDAAGGPVFLYLLAAIHARLGQHQAAFARLDEMFARPGFYSEKWIERDPWFATLRARPEYHAHFDRWASFKGEVLLGPIKPPSR
jgi:DNA-binding winged helix-turn-helix (wHTH) protein/TolB-like protein